MLLLPLGLGACGSEGGSSDRCTSDGDCTVLGTRCDVERQVCICVSDDACPDGQFCNAVGACQIRAGCSITQDCPDGTFCDVSSGVCLEGEEPVLGAPCGLASHCPFNSVCGPEGRCVEGCFGDGDCRLGQICLDGFCFTGPPGTTICSDADYCAYGDSCGPDNLCFEDTRGPYCRGCTPRTSMNPNPCDDPRNFCLINSQELGGFTNFCGVDCSQGQGCPSGYDCSDVIVLTNSTCGRTADCRCDPERVSFGTGRCALDRPCRPTLPSGEPDPNARFCLVEGAAGCGDATCYVERDRTEGSCGCASDADCPGAGACVEGFCCTGEIRPEEELRCVGGEGRVTGFCTCATDDDCGRDSCDPSSGACLITGFPCTPGQNDCPPISCVNGGCLIGQNCAPEQGLSCSVVSGR